MVLTAGRIVSPDFRTWTEEDAYDWDDPGFHPVLTISPDAVDQAGSPGDSPGWISTVPMSPNTTGIPDAYIALPNAYYHWKFDLTRKSRRGKPIQLPSTLDVAADDEPGRDPMEPHPRAAGPLSGWDPRGSFWSSTLWPANVLAVGDEV